MYIFDHSKKSKMIKPKESTYAMEDSTIVTLDILKKRSKKGTETTANEDLHEQAMYPNIRWLIELGRKF
jgi:hypothetical protein